MTSHSDLKPGTLVWDRLHKRYGIKAFSSHADPFTIRLFSGASGILAWKNCQVIADRIILPPPPADDV